MSPSVLPLVALAAFQSTQLAAGPTAEAPSSLAPHHAAPLLASTPFQAPRLDHVSLLTGQERATAGRGLAGYSSLSGLALDRATGTFYALSAGTVLRVDPNSGARRVVCRTADRLDHIAFDPVTRRLIGQDFSEGYAAIDPVTGTTTHTGNGGTFAMGGGLAIHPVTNVLYGVASVSFLPFLFTIDPLTGQELAVGGGDLGRLVDSIAFDPDTAVLYGVNTTELFTIDLVTATTTLVANHAGAIDGLTFDPARGKLVGADGAREEFVELDPATGSLSSLAAFGLDDVDGTARDSATGRLFGVAGVRLLEIDEATGDWTQVGSAVSVGDLHCLTFDASSGQLFSVDSATQTLLALDPDTAQTQVVGSTGAGRIEGLAWDPVGPRLFAADAESDELLELDPATGAASVVGPLGWSDVEGLAVDPGSGSLFGARDALEGGLLLIDSNTGAGSLVGNAHPRVRSLSPGSAAGELFGTDRDADLIRVDLASGAGTTVGALGFDSVAGLAYDGNARVLYGSDTWTGYLVRIDPASGEGTAVGPIGFGNVAGLAHDARRGVLYGFDNTTDQLLQLDVATGAGRALAAFPGATYDGLAWDPTGAVLYASDSGFPGELVRIDPVSGSSTVVGSLGLQTVRGLAFHPATGVLYGAGWRDRELLSIDRATAASTLVGDLFQRPDGLAPLP